MEKERENNFTLSLALVDLFPVMLFVANAIIIGLKINSILFIIGAVICFLSGTLKASWKIIYVVRNKDLWVMNKQLRIMMPIGFLLMIIGIALSWNNVIGVLKANVMWIVYVFASLFIISMIAMFVFAFALDKKSCKANWIEELTNSFGQLMLLMALILI